MYGSGHTVCVITCVASVSVGLSAGLKLFSLSERAIFASPKSEKCLERAEKPTQTLATRANIILNQQFKHILKAYLPHLKIFKVFKFFTHSVRQI